MIKKNKGITLIALVITIIVLLILAMVSVNAIVGENGLITRAMESKLVTTIADIVFGLESDIVDINIDRILNKAEYTSRDTIVALSSKGKISKALPSFANFILNSSSFTANVDILDNGLKGLTIGYNGDIWYENYKRGKINLSQNIEEIYSQDKKTKIRVVDGNIEEIIPNSTYCLHGLEGRSDFACWINNYGELVSIYEDTMIYTNAPEQEYIAIYDNDTKLLLWIFQGATPMGITIDIYNETSGSTVAEMRCIHSECPVYYDGSELYGSSIIRKTSGIKGEEFLILLSDKLEDLVVEDGGFPTHKNEDGEDVFNLDMYGIESDRVSNTKNYERTYWKATIDGKIVPYLKSFSTLNEMSIVDGASVYISNIVKKYKDKGVKRLYYRVGFQYYNNLIVENWDGNGSPWELDSKSQLGLGPTIKYIDI